MIELRNVEKFYQHGPAKTFVLRRISTEIREGEFVSVSYTHLTLPTN